MFFNGCCCVYVFYVTPDTTSHFVEMSQVDSDKSDAEDEVPLSLIEDIFGITVLEVVQRPTHYRGCCHLKETRRSSNWVELAQAQIPFHWECLDCGMKIVVQNKPPPENCHFCQQKTHVKPNGVEWAYLCECN